MTESTAQAGRVTPLSLLGGELGGDGAHSAQVGPQPLAGLPPRSRPLRQPLLWQQ